MYYIDTARNWYCGREHTTEMVTTAHQREHGLLRQVAAQLGQLSEGFKSQLTSHKNFDAGVIEKLVSEIAETSSATGSVGQHAHQMKQKMIAQQSKLISQLQSTQINHQVMLHAYSWCTLTFGQAHDISGLLSAATHTFDNKNVRFSYDLSTVLNADWQMEFQNGLSSLKEQLYQKQSEALDAMVDTESNQV